MQARLEVQHTREEVQDALVDPEQRAGQPRARLEVDQSPSTERGGGCERAPVRARERRERETERRALNQAAALRACHERCERRIELDARTQQQHVALEGGKREPLDQLRELILAGGWWRRLRGAWSALAGCSSLAIRQRGLEAHTQC